MRAYFIYMMFSVSCFVFCHEDKPTVNTGQLASTGARSEALFFIKNKKNFLYQYLNEKVPKIELELKDKKLTVAPELKKLIEELDKVIAKFNSGENITQTLINEEIQKVKSLKNLLDIQDSIAQLLKECIIKANVSKNNQQKLVEHQKKLLKLKSKLSGDNSLKELEKTVKDFEAFLDDCKKFKNSTAHKLEKLKQDRDEIHKRTAQAFSVKKEDLMSWWPIYLIELEKKV